MTLKRTNDPVTGDVVVGEHYAVVFKVTSDLKQSRNIDCIQSLATIIAPNLR